MMYERFILCQDSLKNVEAYGKITGFSFQVRIPYYRGIPLCMLEDLKVFVDGVEYGKDQFKFKVSGGAFTLDEMPTITFFRWEFGEKAEIIVDKPGGLSPGEHDVRVEILLRISYMPFRGYTPAWAKMKLA